ncbi:MAG: permease [Candidatus Omnitrophica bacterium]|nr:permease [Candidatus Omnitrophota bacterium]
MLRLLADFLVYSLLGLDPDSSLGHVLNFFIYDFVKIILLLFVMIAVIGFLRSYLPPQKVKQWLQGRKFLGHLFAALFGAVTPFCSCSSIPVFLSFLKAGVSLGVTFSFLIASPLINEYLVVLMLGFFGWKITFFYVLSGVVIGVSVGLILDNMKMENLIVSDLRDVQEQGDPETAQGQKLSDRFHFGLKEAVSVVKKIWVWVFVGVGLGAVIHNYVPQEVVQSIISKTGVFSVPLAVLLGVPMYGSCAAIVPIAVVLFKKGIPLGTALAFMMATAALSLPEAIMLRRAIRLKLIAIFFGITTLGIIFIGYLINMLQGFLV